jgi:hypothetical protein
MFLSDYFSWGFKLFIFISVQFLLSEVSRNFIHSNSNRKTLTWFGSWFSFITKSDSVLSVNLCPYRLKEFNSFQFIPGINLKLKNIVPFLPASIQNFFKSVNQMFLYLYLLNTIHTNGGISKYKTLLLFYFAKGHI